MKSPVNFFPSTNIYNRLLKLIYLMYPLQATNTMASLLVFLVPLCVFSTVSVKGASEGLDFGKGTHVLGKFFIHYLNSQPEDIKLSEGVHLVSIKSDLTGRSLNKDKTVLGAIENYLQSHEIRIKLPELMPGEEFGRSFKEAIEDIDESNEGK